MTAEEMASLIADWVTERRQRARDEERWRAANCKHGRMMTLDEAAGLRAEFPPIRNCHDGTLRGAVRTFLDVASRTLWAIGYDGSDHDWWKTFKRWASLTCGWGAGASGSGAFDVLTAFYLDGAYGARGEDPYFYGIDKINAALADRGEAPLWSESPGDPRTGKGMRP